MEEMNVEFLAGRCCPDWDEGEGCRVWPQSWWFPRPSDPATKLSQMTCLTWSSLQAEGKEPCPQVIGIALGLSVTVCKMVD